MIELPKEDALFTEREAAAILNMTPRMLAARRKAGKIGCCKDGRYVVYSGKQIADYIGSQQQAVTLRHIRPDKLLEALGEHLSRGKSSWVRPLRRPK